jgi:hypothetical protein
MCPFVSYSLYTLPINGLTASRRCSSSLPLVTSRPLSRPCWMPSGCRHCSRYRICYLFNGHHVFVCREVPHSAKAFCIPFALLEEPCPRLHLAQTPPFCVDGCITPKRAISWMDQAKSVGAESEVRAQPTKDKAITRPRKGRPPKSAKHETKQNKNRNETTRKDQETQPRNERCKLEPTRKYVRRVIGTRNVRNLSPLCKDCRLLCSYYVIGLTLYMSYGFYLFGYQSLLKPLVHHLSPSHYLYTRCLSFYKGYR